jgi:hypothetical protein
MAIELKRLNQYQLKAIAMPGLKNRTLSILTMRNNQFGKCKLRIYLFGIIAQTKLKTKSDCATKASKETDL